MKKILFIILAAAGCSVVHSAVYASSNTLTQANETSTEWDVDTLACVEVIDVYDTIGSAAGNRPDLYSIYDEMSDEALLEQILGNEDANALYVLAIRVLISATESEEQDLAIDMLGKAAEMGNTDAMYMLARIVLESDDLTQDETDSALELLLTAIEMGNREALEWAISAGIMVK